MKKDYSFNSETRWCKLSDGTIVPYDVCAQMPDAYDTSFKCIGTGVIYKINGVLQIDTRIFYFYVRR